MDPRGTIGSIYKGEYYTLVHTTYGNSGPYGFGEEDFFFLFLARLHEVHRAIVVTSVVPVYVYVYVRVTLSFKVFYKSISLDHVDGSS